ncbi:hypothetical protein SAMN04487930_103216 [Cytophaga hutchinsonii ATCC 33406]|nr:hypothetical protein SAMN04487930_103216 [Cytophaga hutchinsonii ATCC 33406]
MLTTACIKKESLPFNRRLSFLEMFMITEQEQYQPEPVLFQLLHQIQVQ